MIKTLPLFIKACFGIILLSLCIEGNSQVNQIDITRVNQMPDLPQPYIMRDWKNIAAQYDAFIFDQSKTGQYLPVVGIKSSGYNFPSLQPILLDTYIGTPSTTQAEAINIIPAIVGASLLDINKSNQNGINWVDKIKDFYNSKNGANVYLNGYNAISGSDWWYDLMPNVFFYQLTTLYPSDPQFELQLTSVADQWLKAVHTMGGKTTPWTTPQMNYRAWNLLTMAGNVEGVKEPEASGAIAWILYNAYVKTGDRKYLDGAQMSLEFLSGLTSNPSYELQLPYGTLTAAKMNALHGSNFNIDKMLNWSFNRGTLRGWGTIVGKWDGKDISGLVGEANDNGNDYAFLMNGFQQASALVPLMKYDKRYAKAISKWVLNLANASRFFYPQYLDASRQDDFAWSNQYDPSSVIAYEALKENWEGKALYGTGDAKRNGWAATNLALYGSSHVGYLAAIVEQTEIEGILQLDLNKTDFFGDNTFQSYAYYNPYETEKLVTIHLGESTFSLYDAISESNIAENVSGDYQIKINPREVLLLTLVPQNTAITVSDGKLVSDNHIIDFHYGYNFTPLFRLKSLAATSEVAEFSETITIYAETENAPASVEYSWYINEELLTTTTTGQLLWTTPSVEGVNNIRVEMVSGTEIIAGVITITVKEHIPQAPVITTIERNKPFAYEQQEVRLICRSDQATTDKLTYTWQVPANTYSQNDSLIVFTAPASEGIYNVNCTITNSAGLSADGIVKLLVKNETEEAYDPLAYYPLNADTKDYSGHDFHATTMGTQEANDALGNKDFAYGITSGDDIIYVPNMLSLNFVDEITLSCWISVKNTTHEAFILSHGSWEERWKLSITPDRKLRWTVKTSEGVKDLDSTFPIVNDKYYHVTVTYTGYSLELYIDGVLNNYLDHSGSILTTSKPLTFGQKNLNEVQYYLNGIIDEVKIFHDALQPWQIEPLKTLWHDEPVTNLETIENKAISVYPNPASTSELYITAPYQHIKEINIISIDGRKKKHFL